MIEKVYYGQCDHYFSKSDHLYDCPLVRYIEVSPIIGKPKHLIICSEFIRAKIKDAEINELHYGTGYTLYSWIIEGIIDEVFKDTYSYKNEPNSNNINFLTRTPVRDSKINPYLSYTFCSRPYIIRSIKLSEAINIILLHKNKVNANFMIGVFDRISSVTEYLDKHYLLKRNRDRIESLLKRLRRYPFHNENLDEYIRDIVIAFFEIMCNSKQKDYENKGHALIT